MRQEREWVNAGCGFGRACDTPLAPLEGRKCGSGDVHGMASCGGCVCMVWKILRVIVEELICH